MELKDTARQYAAVTCADANKLQRGEGIVSFETKEDAREPMEKMDGRELMGRQIKLDYEFPEEFGETKRERSRSPRKSRSRSPQQRNDRDRSGSRDNTNDEEDDDANRERSRSP